MNTLTEEYIKTRLKEIEKEIAKLTQQLCNISNNDSGDDESILLRRSRIKKESEDLIKSLNIMKEEKDKQDMCKVSDVPLSAYLFPLHLMEN